MTEEAEKVTIEDIRKIKEAQSNAVLVTAQAEKAVALARVAELETNNIILGIYNKYDLKVGVDNIMENGNIVRKEETPTAEETKDTVPPPPETEQETQ